MLDNHSTISGKRILFVSIAQAVLGVLSMHLVAAILDLPFGLAGQVLLTFCISQIACLMLMFAENRKPTWVDFSTLFLAISLLASGLAPGGALSVYVPSNMKPTDQRIYLFLIGIAIWLGLIAVFCLVAFIDRLVIVAIQAGVRIVQGSLMRKKDSSAETFSIANILLGTTIVAILLTVLSNPAWDSWDLNVPRLWIARTMLASLVPFFITWGLWLAVTKGRSWWSIAICQCLMLMSWPFVVYHLFLDSFLIKSRGLPVLLYDELLPGLDKCLAVLFLLAISACVVQLTWFCLFLSRSWRNLGTMERQVLQPTAKGSETIEPALMSAE